jgi:hypothetical protein
MYLVSWASTVVITGFPVEEHDHILVLVNQLHIVPQGGTDLLPGIFGLVDGFLQPLGQDRGHEVVDDVEDVFLAADVIVHGAHGKARRLGDLADRGPVEPFCGEDLYGTLDDLLAPQVDKPCVLDVGVDFFSVDLHFPLPSQGVMLPRNHTMHQKVLRRKTFCFVRIRCYDR